MYGLSPEAGLAYSDDGSCTWHRAGGVLATAIASDYFVDRSDPERVLAIAASVDANGDILPQAIYASSDAGQTFGDTPLYTAPPSSNLVSLEIARSNPNIVYAAMFGYPGRHPVLLRSEDGGGTWTPRDIEAALGGYEFRILAVDPDAADRLYLRVVGLGFERVAVTADGGATFVTGVELVNGTLSGFVRMPSGTLLVSGLENLPGGATNGLGWRSNDRGASFVPWTLSPAPHVLGLAERAGVLYLAGKNYSDGWALARSSDEGATITPFASYEDVSGIKPCVQESCAATCAYEVMAAVWTSEVCTPAPPKPGDPGCGCSAARPDGEAVGMLSVWWLAAILLSRRRPARQCKPRGVD
jgi:hypothetical protein